MFLFLIIMCVSFTPSALRQAQKAFFDFSFFPLTASSPDVCVVWADLNRMTRDLWQVERGVNAWVYSRHEQEDKLWAEHWLTEERDPCFTSFYYGLSVFSVLLNNSSATPTRRRFSCSFSVSVSSEAMHALPALELDNCSRSRWKSGSCWYF